jgi:amino acid adenylation domain-containing protein
MKGLLQEWVTERAAHRPDAIAVVLGPNRMSYAELDRRSSQLAHLLRSNGCRRGDRVCFLMPKSPAAIVAMLGILKADCMHVPIDPGSPAPRIAHILDACENRWLVAGGGVAALISELLKEKRFRQRLALGWMEPNPVQGENFRTEFSWKDLSSFSSEPPPTETRPDEPAHILFTSGSTGLPKGVPITHANVQHFVSWAVKYFGMTSADRNSGHPPLHFDLSQFDIFGTFASGGELHLVPAELNLMANKLAEFIRASQLTQWFSVPSILHYMAKFDVVRQNDFPTLKRVLWCGEVFATPALIYWMKRLPKVQFTNLYGPTEATIASSYYTVPEVPRDDRARVPIGTACDGEELLVLDEQLQPLPMGEIGNLYIGGVGLSPGYWRDAEKTVEAFHSFSTSGEPGRRIYKTGDLAYVGEEELVYFVGRADSQIKSRGYRIELGEIEAAANALPALKECAIVAIPTNDFEGMLVCCAYVLTSGYEATAALVRKKLAELLPSYMLPSKWAEFEHLPKNLNGKIDRPWLRDYFLSTTALAQEIPSVVEPDWPQPSQYVHEAADSINRTRKHSRPAA